MMAKAQEKGVKLLLPVDAVCIKDFPDPIDAPVETTVVPVTAIPADMEGCRHRPRDHEAVCRCCQGIQDRCVERPHGRVRETPLWQLALWQLPRLWLRAMLPP